VGRKGKNKGRGWEGGAFALTVPDQKEWRKGKERQIDDQPSLGMRKQVGGKAWREQK